MKISKATSKDKVQLKKEVFITWERPQVLSAYVKQIKKARKQVAKWNVKVLDDDIMINLVDQMYASDWFSEETMMAWEETQDAQMTWAKCQAFFEAAYIERKQYNKAKGQTNQSLNKVTEHNLQMYLSIIKMKAT